MGSHLLQRARTLISVATLAGVAPAQEMLYGIHQIGGVYVIDPSTATIVDLLPWQGFPTWHQMERATQVDGRIISLNRTANTIWSTHPANAAALSIGSTGANFNLNQNLGFEWVPQQLAIVVVDEEVVYSVDESTGAAAFTGFLTGLAQYDCICSLGTDPSGALIGFGGWTTFQPGIAVYQLDLAALTANWLAYLAAPTGARILDVALRSNGELWATVQTFSSATTGIYRIDLGSMTMTLLLAMTSPPMGIAFGPATVTSPYCTAKTTSNGCLPAISGTGNASPTATSGYTIACTNARNQTSGILTFGLNGGAVLPFGGGTMCVAQPRLRAGMWNSGGSALPALDCTGAWSVDFNTWISNHLPIPSGTTVWAQWVGRDNGFAPSNNYSLSNALEFTLIP